LTGGLPGAAGPDAARIAHRAAERAGRLPMWVVYGPGTREYPGSFVARLWAALPEPTPTGTVLLGPSLEAVRAQVPPGCVRLGRQPGDAHEIVETWL